MLMMRVQTSHLRTTRPELSRSIKISSKLKIINSLKFLIKFLLRMTTVTVITIVFPKSLHLMLWSSVFLVA